MLTVAILFFRRGEELISNTVYVILKVGSFHCLFVYLLGSSSAKPQTKKVKHCLH